MNIAIVDDSFADCSQLVSDIKKHAKENNILVYISSYQSGEAFLEQELLPVLDVVFLDIYMGVINGMEVAETIRTLNLTCEIVFITSSPAYAVQSYGVRAFHYIVKPYKQKDLTDVLDMLDKKFRKSSRYIKIKEGRVWIKVLLTDILYVDYYNHYVQLHTENAIISTYMKFSEIEEKLLVHQEFYRCYRCIVINMLKIKKVDELFFLLSNGEYIPINRKRVKEIKEDYANYIFGSIEEDDKNDLI